jgi:uncharacterized membrane protein
MRTIARFLLGAFLFYSGTAHLNWARAEFQAQVPAWSPIDADLVVILSGIVEILLGALLFLPRNEIQMGWLTAAFFVAIFPGNVWQYVDGVDGFGLDTDRARLIRLFFQPVLVAWALWSTGAWKAWRESRG